MTDGLDLDGVIIHNSQDVKAWPITATLDKLEFRSTGVHIEHSKRFGANAWPNFRPLGWTGDLQYTLWIFLNIGGQWHGTGGIQFWQDCDQNGGPPEEFAKNWYYDTNRWAPMTGHQPASGETVGFMVSAGDARGNGLHPVSERSQIVVMPFPTSGTVWTPTDTPPPPPPPTPPTPPTPPDVPPTIPTEVLPLLNTIRDEVILTKLQDAELVAKVNELSAKVDAVLEAVKNQPAMSAPDYAGRITLKVLGRETSADILLKPQAKS